MGVAASRRVTVSAGLRQRGDAQDGLAGGSFIGGTKTTLRRVLGEKGVILTAEAQARLDALPERFMDFIATLETVADLGQGESPEPENGRTVRSRPLDGPEHQPEPEHLSTGVMGSQASEAA